MNDALSMHLHADAWLAAIFGYPVFRVTGHGELPKGARKQLPKGDAFVFARVPADHVSRVQELGAAGLRVVDLTLRFSRVPTETAPEIRKGLCVRAARPADYDRVLAIAASTFKYSRFHLDPLVPRKVANEIKRAWMQSYRDGKRGVACLVATEKGAKGAEGPVVGFLGIVEQRAETVKRIIDLIAVDEHTQSGGVGRALVETFAHSALDVAAEVEVGTQAANVPSVRLYETCGFRLAGAEYVLHGHFRDGVPRS